MGNIAIDRRDPDYFVMVALNQVLGGGGAGRLFKISAKKGIYVRSVQFLFSAGSSLVHGMRARKSATEVTDAL